MGCCGLFYGIIVRGFGNAGYIVDLEKVDELLPLHVEYLKKQYEKGNFIASGRKISRTGGIIFSKLKSLEKLQEV